MTAHTDADARAALVEALDAARSPSTFTMAGKVLDALADAGYRLVTEADVLGWEIRDRDGDVLSDEFPPAAGGRAAELVAKMNAIDLSNAPFVLCAVVPWTQKEPDDG